jgi:hypothetical protein
MTPLIKLKVQGGYLLPISKEDKIELFRALRIKRIPFCSFKIYAEAALRQGAYLKIHI